MCSIHPHTHAETKEGNLTQSPRSVLSLDMEMCVKAIVSSIMLLRRSCTVVFNEDDTGTVQP